MIPRSPRDAVEGVRDGRLVVRVTAPPVDSAANQAVIDVLADTFDVPRRAVRIVTGERSRTKVVEVDGISAEALRAFGYSPDSRQS